MWKEKFAVSPKLCKEHDADPNIDKECGHWQEVILFKYYKSSWKELGTVKTMEKMFFFLSETFCPFILNWAARNSEVAN